MAGCQDGEDRPALRVASFFGCALMVAMFPRAAIPGRTPPSGCIGEPANSGGVLTRMTWLTNICSRDFEKTSETAEFASHFRMTLFNDLDKWQNVSQFNGVRLGE